MVLQTAIFLHDYMLLIFKFEMACLGLHAQFIGNKRSENPCSLQCNAKKDCIKTGKKYSIHWALRPASVKGVEVAKPNGSR